MKKSQLRQIIQEEIQKIFENEETKNLLPSEAQQAYGKMLTQDEYEELSKEYNEIFKTSLSNLEKNKKLKEKSLKINSYPKFQIRSGHEDALLKIKEDFDNWVTEFKKEYNESPEFELETKLSNTYFLKVNNPEFQKKKERSLKAAEDFYKTLKYKGD